MIIEVSAKILKMTGLLCVIAIAGILYWYMNDSYSIDTVPVINESSAEEVSEEEAVSEEEPVKDVPVLMAVHVSGAVVNTDRVYYLEEGSRVEHAIQAAGGSCEDADLSQLNLARVLQDGEKVYVPVMGEVLEENSQNPVQDITENNEKPLTNINLATTIELMELPGIGKSYAERIVDYRDAHGGFQNIEEIKNVSGIGDNTFEKIKDKITVSG